MQFCTGVVLSQVTIYSLFHTRSVFPTQMCRVFSLLCYRRLIKSFITGDSSNLTQRFNQNTTSYIGLLSRIIQKFNITRNFHKKFENFDLLRVNVEETESLNK